MSYVLTSDYAALPAALLPIAKEHLRVLFNDEDASITRMIGYAIGYFENFCDVSVFGGSAVWSPVLTTGASAYEIPTQLRPVSSFTVTSVLGGGTVSSLYELRSSSPVAPIWLARKDGTAFHTDAVITLAIGYAGAAAIPPSVLGTIMRVTATLYENRESISAVSLEQMPFWLNDLMGAHWVPRA